jgi:hypothetical protein
MQLWSIPVCAQSGVVIARSVWSSHDNRRGSSPVPPLLAIIEILVLPVMGDAP